jgi:hypothetical protein
MDESSWGFGGYMAECGGRIINKKVSKGGQTTFGWIFTDAILGHTSIDTSFKLQQHVQMGSVTKDKQKW